MMVYKKKSKKGMTQMWWIIASAILALLVVILIVLWFRGAGDKAFDAIGDKIGGLKDCDKDNVGDLFDKCVCTPGTEDGCPQNADELLKKLKRSDNNCNCVDA